jgi:hypothetical protein
MSSDQTRHTAAVVPGAVIEGGPTAWSVSWLPDRLLLRNQAITAMTIAEVVVTHADDLADSRHKMWLFVDGWAAELGITGPNAVAEASLSPEDHEDMPRVRTLATGGQPGRIGYLIALDRSTGTARIRIDGETVTVLAGSLQYADARAKPSSPAAAERDASRVGEDDSAAPCSLCQLRAARGIEPPPGGCTCPAGQLAERSAASAR